MRRTGHPVFEILFIARPILAIVIWIVAEALDALFR
jgi:hypothetical protein